MLHMLSSSCYQCYCIVLFTEQQEKACTLLVQIYLLKIFPICTWSSLCAKPKKTQACSQSVLTICPSVPLTPLQIPVYVHKWSMR